MRKEGWFVADRDYRRICGNCRHAVLSWTKHKIPRPTDNPGECTATAQITAPISLRIQQERVAIWPEMDAAQCPLYEFLHPILRSAKRTS